jgi:hypothetical protein
MWNNQAHDVGLLNHA